MSKPIYILIATAAILFGAFYNYSMVPAGSQSSGSRTYVPGGSGGGFSGGHK